MGGNLEEEGRREGGEEERNETTSEVSRVTEIHTRDYVHSPVHFSILCTHV